MREISRKHRDHLARYKACTANGLTWDEGIDSYAYAIASAPVPPSINHDPNIEVEQWRLASVSRAIFMTLSSGGRPDREPLLTVHSFRNASKVFEMYPRYVHTACTLCFLSTFLLCLFNPASHLVPVQAPCLRYSRVLSLGVPICPNSVS